MWNHIWKLQVPQRLRCFLWLTCRKKLMTNLERCKHTLTDVSLCPICHRSEESTLHALRDCVNLRQVWRCTIRQLKPAPVVNPLSAATPSPKPEPGWLCPNIDGSVSLSNGEATIGALDNYEDGAELLILFGHRVLTIRLPISLLGLLIILPLKRPSSRSTYCNLQHSY
ncbi:hypothetical protein V6N11_049356 [Hibiscus sabdariffa]|uniref:Reverse transcriptase zinc-binding domain-containing protein n=1 Tax=Hibiscus sabdariffa TaxID=183260 RepID=A0ABR2P092_9ROSI